MIPDEELFVGQRLIAMDNAGTFLVYAFFGLIGWSIYRSFNSRSAIMITVERENVIAAHGISRRALSQLETFFRQDVQLESKVVIRGQHNAHGRLRYQFKGSISPGTEQQIRNFLHTIIPPNRPKSRRNSCA